MVKCLYQITIKNPVTTILLMGPGLSNVNKRMFDALAKPIIGHLDPDFLGIMDVTIQMLREVFMTSNKLINPDIHHRKLRSWKGDYFEVEDKELGIDLFAQEGFRLPLLVSIVLQEVIDDSSVRLKLLKDYGIEIGVGLGRTRGQIRRVGLMGETGTKPNVDIFTNTLKEIIGKYLLYDYV